MSEATLSLTLSPDNPSNTTLISQTGETFYSVTTEHTKKATFTQVRNRKEEIIASLEWRDVLPDKVTIGANKPMSMMDWMKRSIVPFKDDISWSDDTGRKYKWKGNSAGRTFELYSADDNYSSVIAKFHRARRIYASNYESPDPNASTSSLAPTLVGGASAGGKTPAYLELTSRAIEVQDLVVSSFLFLEKTHRTNETEHQNRADVLGTPAISISGNHAIHNGGV